MFYTLRRMILGPSTAEAFFEAELEAERSAQKAPDAESPSDVYDEQEWIRTRTLDDDILPVEYVRRSKRLRALWNYDSGIASESDLDCFSKEELDRLESVSIQIRWDQFLGRPKGIDARPGRFFL